MKEFLFWLNLFVALLVVVFIVFFAVAYATGGGLGNTEQRVLIGGFLAVIALSALGYILDPDAERIKRRRRW